MRALLGAISVFGAPGRPSRHSFRVGPAAVRPSHHHRSLREGRLIPAPGPALWPQSAGRGSSGAVGPRCSLCNARAGLGRILVLSCHDGGLRSPPVPTAALSVGKAAALGYRYGAARGATRTARSRWATRPPATRLTPTAATAPLRRLTAELSVQGCLAGARCGTACGAAHTASSRWAPTAA